MSDQDQNLDRLQSAFQELRSINQVLDRICLIPESNHIMEVIVGELVNLTGADQGVISLVSQDEEQLLQTVARRTPDQPEDLPYKVGRLVAGWVIKHRRHLKIDDLDASKEVPGLSSEGGRFKSLICHPMMVRDEPIGLVTLVRQADAGPFTDDQARVSGILTSQSAHILAHARVFEEVTEKNRLLRTAERKLREENARLQLEVSSTFAFENIVGKSVAIKRVLALASRFAPMDAPVLVFGDTGTGKELVARAIHYNSPRKERTFVVKNCGVKTETLLESELFGHVKGAFTGADRDRKGLFEEADGGTIFLDEIGDAPLSTQVAVLRAIQSGEIRPVGSTRMRQVNVRVISATNKDLKSEIEAGRFREDLFYRISTFAVQLPALRERSEDIPLLAEHTLKRLQITTGRDELSIAPEAMDVMMKHPWPGNVRQLENEIERAAVVCDLDGCIRPEHFSADIRSWQPGAPGQTAYQGRLRDIVERVEIDAIREALTEQGGNILRTAEDLGLTRKGLKDKMTRYGIAARDAPDVG